MSKNNDLEIKIWKRQINEDYNVSCTEELEKHKTYQREYYGL